MTLFWRWRTHAANSALLPTPLPPSSVSGLRDSWMVFGSQYSSKVLCTCVGMTQGQTNDTHTQTRIIQLVAWTSQQSMEYPHDLQYFQGPWWCYLSTSWLLEVGTHARCARWYASITFWKASWRSSSVVSVASTLDISVLSIPPDTRDKNVTDIIAPMRTKSLNEKNARN